MKKNFAARAATLTVALSVIAGLTACGEETRVLDSNRDKSQFVEADGTIKKPASIKLVTDTNLTEENRRDLFMKEYEELTGIKLDIEQPAHNQYYEKINLSFAGGRMPDAMEVGNTYYPNYANYGALFDMTEAWEESDLKNGKLKDVNGNTVKMEEKYVDALKITRDVNGDGQITPEEENRLYGFPMTRGNGTVTYVRGDWLKKVGDEGKLGYKHDISEFKYKGNNVFSQEDMEEDFSDSSNKTNSSGKKYGDYVQYMPQNYDEFLTMLRAFKEIKDGVSPITAAGLINTEAPYDMYLREFYQNARPDFYIPEGSDKYVDGMSEPQMIDALKRMKAAYDEGLMDREVITNKTSTARNKFYESKIGVFNYWSGMWCKNLNQDLQKQDPDGVAVPMPPLVETEYIERPPTALAVTTAAENPWGVFKWLCEFSHDGAEGQMLFSRGVEGPVGEGHYKWVDKAANKAEALTPPASPDSQDLVQKAWFSPELSINNFPDPIEIDNKITFSLDLFAKTSRVNPVPKMTLNIADAMTEISTIRAEVIAKTIQGDMSPEEAIKEYERRAENEIAVMMKELNGDEE